MILYYVKQNGLYYAGKNYEGVISWANERKMAVGLKTREAAELRCKEYGEGTEIEEARYRMNIYLSSSWKNRDRVRALAIELRKRGVEVYDFTDPKSRGIPEIPPEMFPEQFDPSATKYHEYLRSFPQWRESVNCNRRAIERCDMIILMLPCGNDAHADAFYGLGKDKTLIVVGQPKAGDRTPTHLWADAILDEDDDVLHLVDRVEQ